jgi:GNAT superfamily N-acetyltransferase
MTKSGETRIEEVPAGCLDDLDRRINLFNAAQLAFGGTLEREIGYAVKDGHQKIVGGVKGCVYLQECLYISILFVDEPYRARGLGRSLMNRAEQEARRAGVRLVHLNTFDFQATGFYEKLGYEVFGVLDHCPAGHRRYYMKKMLGDPD